jgi:formamidopyrimidine-DNA glycosylase
MKKKLKNVALPRKEVKCVYCGHVANVLKVEGRETWICPVCKKVNPYV